MPRIVYHVSSDSTEELSEFRYHPVARFTFRHRMREVFIPRAEPLPRSFRRWDSCILPTDPMPKPIRIFVCETAGCATWTSRDPDITQEEQERIEATVVAGGFFHGG